MTEKEEENMDSFKWCEVVNRWFTGGYVTEDEIVQLATMNLFDFASSSDRWPGMCDHLLPTTRDGVVRREHPGKLGLQAPKRCDP